MGQGVNLFEINCFVNQTYFCRMHLLIISMQEFPVKYLLYYFYY